MAPAKKKSSGSKKQSAAKKPAVKKSSKKAAPKQAPKKEQSKKAAAPAAQKKEETRAEKPAQKLQGIRIRLSAFDHAVLDEAALKIVDTSERTGAIVSGPLPLPTKIKKFTVNRSTFVHKDARDQFEMRIHRRLISLSETTFKTVDALQNLSLPSGVNIEIRMG